MECVCGKAACEVPYGYCHCRCGQKTVIASRTDRKRFQFKGRPMRYMARHQNARRVSDDGEAPFRIDGSYCRFIPLHDRLIIIVDADQYEKVVGLAAWAAVKNADASTYYAGGKLRKSDGADHTPFVFIHRVIAGLDKTDVRRVDHRNGNGLDNRRANLRIALHAENMRNTKLRRTNTSGRKGVSFIKATGHWRARVNLNGECVFYKVFTTKQEAESAYWTAAQRFHGEFARRR